MRRGLLVGAGVGALNAGLALLLVWWFGRRPAEFGWYAYSPLNGRFSDYFGSVTPRWEIIAVTVGAFVLANAAVGALVVRRRRRRSPAGAGAA